jgi:Tfp pilus assembly protein PilV
VNWLMCRFQRSARQVAALGDWLVATTKRGRTPAEADRGGASLVEVMIAMVISAVLLASVLGLLDSASTVAQSMEMRAETAERVATLRDRLGSVVQSSTAPLRCVAGTDIATTSVTTASTSDPVTDDRTDPTCTRLETFDTALLSASPIEVCGLARSKAPVTISAETPPSGSSVALSAPRIGCVRIENSTVVYTTVDTEATSTDSAAPNAELILTNATQAGFVYFTAESEQLVPAEATGVLSDIDRLRVRRVVFVAVIETRQGRISEDVQVEFALGAARWGAEQSWKGRIGASLTSRDSP